MFVYWGSMHPHCSRSGPRRMRLQPAGQSEQFHKDLDETTSPLGHCSAGAGGSHSQDGEPVFHSQPKV